MWINTESLVVYKYIHEIRQYFSNISFTENITKEDLKVLGVYEVEPTTPPEYNLINEKLVELQPILVDNAWTQQWSIEPATESEILNNTISVRNSIITATQQRLDSFAQSRNYDTILSLATYATSTVPKFAQEGQYGVTARDATWSKLYEIMAEVEVGTRPQPTSFDDIQLELPPLVWPEAQ